MDITKNSLSKSIKLLIDFFNAVININSIQKKKLFMFILLNRKIAKR